jgi:hypothetical protein
LITVENCIRPNWTENSGTDVPWIMAWTAIGSTGVAVGPLVSVMAGEGVITKNVGVFCGAVGVPAGGGWVGAGSAV